MDWIKRVGDAFWHPFSGGAQQAKADRQPLGFDIAILSFDRPNYLAKTLKSLRPQMSAKDRVTLFQDGNFDPHTNTAVASWKNIQACVDIFRQIFPWGEIVETRENLGIAFNYERAETHVFEKNGAEACLFLEDDLVLSPGFAGVTARLLGIAGKDPRIAYVSACGNLWAPLDEQRRRSGEFMPMHENWGAAMTRSSWLAERDFRRAYLDLVRGHPYKDRDHGRIKAFYASRGWDCKFTSQDAARWIASLERNAVRLSTFTCHARYIGKHGVHFTPKRFANGKFSHTVMYDGPAPQLAAPTAEWIASCLAQERRRFTGLSQAFYPSHGT